MPRSSACSSMAESLRYERKWRYFVFLAARTKTHKKACFFCDSARSPHRTTKPSRGRLRLVGLKTPTDLSAKQTHARGVTTKNVNLDRGCNVYPRRICFSSRTRTLVWERPSVWLRFVDLSRAPSGKTAQPRSSKKIAASRAGQTPSKRLAVGICLLSDDDDELNTRAHKPAHAVSTLHRALHDGRPVFRFPGADGRLPIQSRCGRFYD